MERIDGPKLDSEAASLAGWKLVDVGYRDVSGGHTVFHEAWQGPEATDDTPWTIHQHGGPGQGFDITHQMVHAPNNRIVLHDQRGAGRSFNDDPEDPFHLQGNTTDALIDDIASLANHMGADTYNLTGGSWGSALSLMHGMRQPDKVNAIMPWAVYTARPDQFDLSINEQARAFAPTEYERLVASVPEDERGSYIEIAQHLFEEVQQVDEDGNPTDVAKSAAVALGLYQYKLAEPINPLDDKTRERYELINSGLVPDIPGPQLFDLYVGMQPESDPLREAAIPLHYYTNESFMAPGIDVLENPEALQGVSVHLVNGEKDLNTPPATAVRVHKALIAAGVDATLQLVEDAGHIRTDSNLLDVLRETSAEHLS